MKKLHFFGLLFSVIFVLLLIFPSVQYFYKVFPEQQLYGYVAPKSSLNKAEKWTWFNKKLQLYWEETFENEVGFKTYLIKLFNELTFRLFSEAPRINLYSTREHGLYSKMSIDNLNDEFINREKLTQNYIIFAKKIKQLQTMLDEKGKRLEIVISTSKPYVYLDGLGKKFLIYPQDDLFAKTASLGQELQLYGVNIIDSGPLLRQFNKDSLIETHPYSGVHWNYYAGCMVAKSLLLDAQKKLSYLPKLDCGEALYKKPYGVDIDGLLLLNIITTGKLDKPTPYPSPRASLNGNYKPKILLVGDSFMDQIVHSLEVTKVYSELTLSSYFKTRIERVANPARIINDTRLNSIDKIQKALLKDALDSDLIILEMVDYNIPRYGYGFIEAMLEYIQKESSSYLGNIRMATVNPTYAQETDGVNWWYWVKDSLTFDLKPSNITSKAKKTRLHFEYETRGEQELTLYLSEQNRKHKFVLSKRSGIQIYDNLLDISPSALTKLSITTSAIASPLGPQDPRLAALIVRNVEITPE
ncbi:MAG: hypothetical protein HYX60_09800 [Legionella longbeachae]|nr:hypothetical protein [Legionella longbeachae]